MVARIKIKNALAANFHYNENKLKEGMATCLLAANYPVDTERLNQAGRYKMLEKLASCNPNIKANSVHISLNFDPSETLSEEQLKDIATAYMERIGFGHQPYLVYQHFDAGHPHIHILSVKVGMDGRGLDTHHVGIKRSEPARKELEEIYNLVKAENRNNQYQLKPAYTQKVQYGKMESRRAIANVLDAVLTGYNYTSLAELNAVLKPYNVMADRCQETSRTYQHQGLVYRILDDSGKPVGVPIKASAFYNRPTLSFLEERFRINATKRQPLKSRAKTAIDLYFLKQQNASLVGMIQHLKKEGIDTIVRQNEAGVVYGLTYVDHKNRAVFNGSDLGKSYSAKAVLEKCHPESVDQQAGMPAQKNIHPSFPAEEDMQGGTFSTDKTMLDILTRSEHSYNATPQELKKGKKKKRKRL